MNISNNSVHDLLIALGLNVRSTGLVTPEEQFDYLLVSVTELPPLDDKPTATIEDVD